MRCISILFAILLFFAPLSGCISSQSSDADFTLATTTSMRDSGLLDVLIPAFEESSGYSVDYVAVGTGAALNLGKQGDADALLVHAPDKEVEFIEQGYAEERHTFAWNRFVILGPHEIKGDLLDALEEIVEEEMCFISRGDASGTHFKEQELWRELNSSHGIEMVEDNEGYHPVGDWFMSIGQGMGAAITMAHEKECFVLSDKGTALHRDDVDLQMMEFESNLTLNLYSYIPISETSVVSEFQEFLLTEGQAIIAEYKINDQQLFNLIE